MITRRFLEAPDGRGWIFLGILAAAAIIVPFLNVFVPPTSPFHVSTTSVALWGKYLCFALLALSLDLVWGYCGILSLGPRRVLRARRLRHGHVPDAPDRHARRLRPSVSCPIS